MSNSALHCSYLYKELVIRKSFTIRGSFFLVFLKRPNPRWSLSDNFSLEVLNLFRILHPFLRQSTNQSKKISTKTPSFCSCGSHSHSSYVVSWVPFGPPPTCGSSDQWCILIGHVLGITGQHQQDIAWTSPQQLGKRTELRAYWAPPIMGI